MLQLDRGCLDRWLGSFDEFRYDFLTFCHSLVKATGRSLEFDQQKLEVAHTAWVGQCRVWEESYLMPGSNGLSHLKIMALLLFALCSVEWLRELYDGYERQPDDLEFAGTDAELAEVKAHIRAGRGIYLSFQFTMLVLNWHEVGRVDKITPFVFRMTKDLQHDILVYLSSQRRDEMAIFLMFKALYARD